jgi:hypothetical protein
MAVAGLPASSAACIIGCSVLRPQFARLSRSDDTSGFASYLAPVITNLYMSKKKEKKAKKAPGKSKKKKG